MDRDYLKLKTNYYVHSCSSFYIFQHHNTEAYGEAKVLMHIFLISEIDGGK